MATTHAGAARTGARTLIVIATTLGVLVGSGLAAFGVGIDVSGWQHTKSLDWSKAKADGVDFAFIKATEGKTYTNPYFAGDWQATTKLGIYRGAYHFARPSIGSAGAQARYFAKAIGSVKDKGDLPPVLDLEATGGLGVKQLRAWTMNWLKTVESLTGRTPMIYVSPSFWESNLGNSTAFHHYPLWVAHYGVSSPRVPGGWSTWTFWQSTSSGSVNGIAGNVDINKFNGNKAQLAKMANTSAPAGSGGDPTGPTAPSGPTHTTLTVTPSVTKVSAGDSVRFTGRLSTSTGGVPNKTVGLWRQYQGATSATRLATATTDSNGRYTFTMQPDQSATYYVRWGGGALYASAVSPTVSVAMTGAVPTTTTMDASSTELYATDKVTFSGTFATASGGVADRSLGLWRQYDGQASPTKIVSTTTDGTGAYALTVAPTNSASYYVRWGGGPLLAASESDPVSVSYLSRIPTTLSLATSRAGAYPSQTVTLSGTLGVTRGVVNGRTVTVVRQVPGQTATSTAATLTTDRKGAFSFSFTPSVTATYTATYAGSSRLASASSSAVNVVARQQVRTTVDLTSHRTRIPKGDGVVLHGHLRGSDGTSLAGRRVVVFRRLVGSSDWVRVNRDLTGTSGYWSLVVSPRVSEVFRAEFLGGIKYLPSHSAGTRIVVR